MLASSAADSAAGHDILLAIAGGVALLLWATRMVRTGILRAFGGQVGRILIGLGLMLLSLQVIVAASAPLRESETLRVVMTALAADPILAVLLGALLASKPRPCTWICCATSNASTPTSPPSPTSLPKPPACCAAPA